jgi:hypothetical protein
MILLRSTPERPMRFGQWDEWDIGTAAERAFRAAGSVAGGSADRDAEGLEKVLAGVSKRHECVRGECERRSSGLPVSRGA